MNFIRSIFSESDGEGSWARVASFMALISVIGWVTFLVLKNHAVPPLGDLTVFISTPYAINKVHDGVTTVMGNKADSSTPPTN